MNEYVMLNSKRAGDDQQIARAEESLDTDHAENLREYIEDLETQQNLGIPARLLLGKWYRKQQDFGKALN